MINWTDEKIEEMFALFRAGKTAGMIGQIFGGSRNAIIGKHQRERIKRGIIPPRPSDTPGQKQGRKPAEAPRVAKTAAPLVTLPILPKPAPKPRTGPLVGILDVTGCRWAIDEDASVIGSKVFCNATQCDGSAYCEEHRKESTASYSREVIRNTIRAAIYVIKRRAA